MVVQWLRIHLGNAGGVGSIPGWRTKFPHATEQLSTWAATIEPMSAGVHVPQLENPCATTTEPVCARAHTSQRESLCAATLSLPATVSVHVPQWRIPHDATKTQHNQLGIFFKKTYP